MATLTVEQHEALKASGKEPLRMLDPVSRREYVLVEAREFEELRLTLGEAAEDAEAEEAAQKRLAAIRITDAELLELAKLCPPPQEWLDDPGDPPCDL